MTTSTPTEATLGELCRELAGIAWTLSGDDALRVRDVRSDSRRVERGDLFVARAGTQVDGARFARDAVERGAAAVLARADAELPELGVPVLRVPDVDAVLGTLAELVWGRPSQALDVVGITGTNGKTTTAWLVARALETVGSPAARLGTLGYELGSDVDAETLTTPGADDLSRYLARARRGGARRFVMEVSSHALAQRRVDAIDFSVAAFTNLTQDHLDYHASMQEYGEAKARLFVDLAPKRAVVNTDDPFGKELARRARAETCITVGRGPESAIHPLDVKLDRHGIRGEVGVPGGSVMLASRLVGRHNLKNLLVALGIGLGLDVPAQPFADALSALGGAPGRLERCDSPDDDLVVLVDYAHTPDALARVLEASRSLTSGKLWCVFGCGGDRDPGKRSKMGAAVGEGADRAIVTNDNPRSERPEAIAEAIVLGLRPTGTPFEVELDRALAIERAVMGASPGDIVLIAGKGHEPYQIVGTERRDFDDRRQARQALALRQEAGR